MTSVPTSTVGPLIVTPVELPPIKPARQTITQQLEKAGPGLGPVEFRMSAAATEVRATLAGVEAQLRTAIETSNGVAARSKTFAQLQSQLEAIERGLSASAVDPAALEQHLAPSERWARGLDLSRSLRLLSEALGRTQSALTERQREEVSKLFTSIHQELSEGAGGLPGVRLPPPALTTNGPGLRVETSDVALVEFAASLPPALTATLQEILRANPGDPLVVLDLLKAKADPVQELKRLALMFPAGGDRAGLRRTLSADLSYRGGTIERDLSALLGKFGVAGKSADALFGMLATAREGFRAGAAGSGEVKENWFDAAGWIHTRMEILHSLQALDMLRGALPASQSQAIDWKRLSQAVWLGTLSSDLYKRGDFHSVLTHNRDGAELMAPLLASRHLGDLSTPENHRILSLAKRFAHDHQIIPAGMMSFLTGMHLTGMPFGHSEITQAIMRKIANPFAAEHKNGELVFSEQEAAVLRDKKIPGWPVPSAEGDLERLVGALAVAWGDAAQYGTADAIAKYAVRVRGPEMGPGMRNPIVSTIAFLLIHPERADELVPGLRAELEQKFGTKDLRAALTAELKAGRIEHLPLGQPETNRGAMESAFEGSHQGCKKTLRDAAPVIGAELAERLALELDQKRADTARLLPELIDKVDQKIRKAAGKREVHFWDRLVPDSGKEPLAADVLAEVQLVKKAFAEAADETFKVPAEPFSIRAGGKS